MNFYPAIDLKNGQFIRLEKGELNQMRIYGNDPVKKAKVLQWLMFQMGGIGPMMGQANVFYRYFPEKIQSVIIFNYERILPSYQKGL